MSAETDAAFYARKALAISRAGQALTKGEYDALGATDTGSTLVVSRRFIHNLDAPVVAPRDFA